MDDENVTPKSSISSEVSVQNANASDEPPVANEIATEPPVPFENANIAESSVQPPHIGVAETEPPTACEIVPEDGIISPELLVPAGTTPKDARLTSESSTYSCGIAPCTFAFGEGGYIRHGSDEISWQHFPRSTSNISSCKLSADEEKRVSASKSSSISSKPEKSQKSSRSSASSGPVMMSIAQLEADHYLRIRYVHEFFNFLISQLMNSEPENPVQFLVDLINQCILARQGEIKPPLLYTEEHVQSVYRAFDPFARGSITFKQYEEAMRTLGLKNRMTPYDRNVSLDEREFVKESTFKNEVKRLLLENFKKMTRIPKDWEENRLRWMKRMAKRQDPIIEASDETSEEVCDEECICEECPNIAKEVSYKNICPYPVPHALRHETALKHEPEQLYL